MIELYASRGANPNSSVASYITVLSASSTESALSSTAAISPSYDTSEVPVAKAPEYYSTSNATIDTTNIAKERPMVAFTLASASVVLAMIRLGFLPAPAWRAGRAGGSETQGSLR